VIERDFRVGESPRVNVAISSGQVTVESGEPGIVKFAVDTKDPTFDIRDRGDVIFASGNRSTRALVTVRVPPMSSVQVSTASGDVEVNAALDRLEVSSASGDVRFDSAVRLQAKTASGSIGGSRVDREASCVTASGDVRLSLIIDQAGISTASGNVAIGRCEGSITCATVSGNIRIDELTGSPVNIKTMSGLVRFAVPPRTRLDLDATSLSGAIHLPGPGSSPEPAEREIRARVRLVSGDLRIERAT
jgi:DUF4097 and DUF4098 domain-containing protein YvlB